MLDLGRFLGRESQLVPLVLLPSLPASTSPRPLSILHMPVSIKNGFLHICVAPQALIDGIQKEILYLHLKSCDFGVAGVLCLGALFVGAFGLVGGAILFSKWVLVPLLVCWLGWHVIRIVVGLSHRLNQDK